VGAHQRRLHVAAFQGFASVQDLAALFAYALQAVQHIFHGAAVDQRTHDCMLVERMSDAHLPVRADESFNDPGRDTALQEETPRGGAALPRGADGAKENGAQHEIGIGIVHHDDAVVPAQFQDGAAQALCDYFRDLAAHFGGTGETDQGNARVANQALVQKAGA
jgi:hypothetical protein